MSVKGHKKHADMVKPDGGKIHRHEIAILGAPCGLIQELSKEISAQLPHLKVGYLDASHSNKATAGVFKAAYTDMINFHQLTFDSAYVEYEWRSLFSNVDVVLVNGNHFKAEKQLVIINEAKKESLERKLDRLTNVLGFILDEGRNEIHDYLKSDFSQHKVVKINDLKAIVGLVQNELKQPEIKGLVLAGGKSIRMGEDKGLIDYHGIPQREYLAKLLTDFCVETYISTSKEMDSSYPLLKDSFTDMGPYSGILSAFRQDPNAAWLVVATDIPLLDAHVLKQLIDGRNASKVATCFHNPETGFPEPLITLWEPRAYTRLLQFLSMGYSCPRKALINSDIEELQIVNQDALLNANTPQEKDHILGKIND